ncbi:hypothetical protein SynSYN20_02933 [Synechococcus sp. SYN20]|nr:hypothetical protein SynSYN20_02933 [Synechococcus sp. SYN20]
MMLTARNFFLVKYQRGYGTHNRRSSCDLSQIQFNRKD